MVSETRATQPSGRNVLEDLDSRIPTSFYWYLAVLACVGGFLFGYDTSNIGSALGFIPYHLSSFWTGLSGGRGVPGRRRGSAHRRAADRPLRTQWTGGSFSASARCRRYWPWRCGPGCPSPPGG